MPEHAAKACLQEKYVRGSMSVGSTLIKNMPAESMPGQHTRGKKALFDGV